MKRLFGIAVFFLLSFVLSSGMTGHLPSPESGDWPQYRADAGRTGYTPSTLSDDLSLSWKMVLAPLSPAWRGSDTRMTFDYAAHTVIAGGMLFFGSSTDCRVYALDAATGKERWSFFTGGPVRFAPAVWKDRVLAGSDDGFLYCLSARSGKLLWKKRGGPDGSMVLGNDVMISRYPVRGGPVVTGNMVCWGAGIWPSEGIYLYALDPETGKELWVNSECGSIEMEQPHPPSVSKSGISAQGYLAVCGERLLVPTGRAVPAVFELASGKFQYFHLRTYAGGWQKNSYGGSRIVAADPWFITASGNTHDRDGSIGGRNAVFDLKTGVLSTRDEFDSPAVAVTPSHVVFLDARDGVLKMTPRKSLLETRMVEPAAFVARAALNTDGDKPVPAPGKSTDAKAGLVGIVSLAEPEPIAQTGVKNAVSLIVAGRKAIIGTADCRVLAVDLGSKSTVWTADVEGVPWGLAVAQGRLYVSTDKGLLYCFGGDRVKRPKIIVSTPENAPWGRNETYAAAAREIVQKTGVRAGYCLDLSCGDGRLSFELARLTDLTIVAVDSDPDAVARARALLFLAGLYGRRVTVLQAETGASGCPDYFADLIVSGRSVTGGKGIVDQKEVTRILRPFGGVACFGAPGSPEMRVRGALDGSDSWTHQYRDPGNTVFSTDDLVRGTLGILWFRDPDFTMPSRHGRGVSPLVCDGRLFVQGLHGIRAFNAYNGRPLWEYFIEDIQKSSDQETHLGINLTQANWCVTKDRVYVRSEDVNGSPNDRYCLVLDAAAGGFIRKIPPPRITGEDTWGYIAVDGDILFGSVVADERQLEFGRDQRLHIDTSKMYDESKALFAMDAESGTLKWMYRPRHSIHHNSIAIGNGRVYLVDRPVPPSPREIRRSATNLQALPEGFLVALDAKTGAVIWEKSGASVHGNLLALNAALDMLVMTYYEAHAYLSLGLLAGVSERMTGFRVSDGEPLWSIPTGVKSSPKSRPVLIDDRVFIEPFSWSITTGEKLDIPFDRSYGCGMVAASRHIMLFRSGVLGYRDLDIPGSQTDSYGGIRPGCWINAIPAGGLVLMPDATEGCNCSYLMRATIALKSK
ncbi:MAG: outer membrane protein assembly factor BamB family protein [Candidatus Latescibacterota bacterium]